MKIVAAFALAVVAAHLVACAPDAGPADGSASADVSAMGAEAGQSCEGYAGLACAQGLVCDVPESAVPDQGGTCVEVKKGELGAACGAGVTGLVVECNAGFHCQAASEGVADTLGTCVRSKAGELGGTCGTGVTGIAVSCQAGLACVEAAHAGAGDAAGYCANPK